MTTSENAKMIDTHIKGQLAWADAVDAVVAARTDRSRFADLTDAEMAAAEALYVKVTAS